MNQVGNSNRTTSPVCTKSDRKKSTVKDVVIGIFVIGFLGASIGLVTVLLLYKDAIFGVNIVTPSTDEEVTTAAGGAGGFSCPDASWTTDTTLQKCYQFVTTPANIDDAKVGCTTLNAAANLVSPKTAEQDAALKLLHVALAPTTCNTGYWTSGLRTVNAGTFTWGDGSALTDTNWATGEPSNDNALCIGYDTADMTWVAKRCVLNKVLCYICEI